MILEDHTLSNPSSLTPVTGLKNGLLLEWPLGTPFLYVGEVNTYVGHKNGYGISVPEIFFNSIIPARGIKCIKSMSILDSNVSTWKNNK